MHKESLQQMEQNLAKYLSPHYAAQILDVGSMDVAKKGSYRSIVPKGCVYTGTDIRPGPNVDVVMQPDEIPFPDNHFKCVISGQCFEHVENPFNLIKEIARVIRPGGYFFGVAPFVFGVHRHPIDCWRILPDGWKSLFKHAGLQTVHTYLYGIDGVNNGRRLRDIEQLDCWGIAEK